METTSSAPAPVAQEPAQEPMQVDQQPAHSRAQGPPTVFFQDLCLKHKNLVSKNDLERPERLRAVAYGVGAIIGRLEQSNKSHTNQNGVHEAAKPPVTIVRSTAVVKDLLDLPAGRAVLGTKLSDTSSTTYAEMLKEWCKQSKKKLKNGEREIPPGYEADLYLSPQSYEAFCGAVATVCEAVDAVAKASLSNPQTPASGPRAFVAVRPPGHHCLPTRPAGVGFVNNVIVGAVHAIQSHHYKRIIILDIDLHHGNGTQRVVQNINEDHSQNKDLNVYFGSVHDIDKYPCDQPESGLRQYAQERFDAEKKEWVENIALAPYDTEAEFWALYETQYTQILTRAKEFLELTDAKPDTAMIFLSCGFGASEFESDGVAGTCRVPPSFFYRFTRDACALADRYAQGRLLSVLEGGYSDRAILSGVMAHVAGLTSVSTHVDPLWWRKEDMLELEKLAVKRMGRKPRPDSLPKWVQRSHQIVQLLKDPLPAGPSTPMRLPPLSAFYTNGVGTDGHVISTRPVARRRRSQAAEEDDEDDEDDDDEDDEDDDDEDEEDEMESEEEADEPLSARGRGRGRGRPRGSRGGRGSVRGTRGGRGRGRGSRGGRGRGSRGGRGRGRGRGAASVSAVLPPEDSSSPSATDNGEAPPASDTVSSVPPEGQSARKRTAPLSSASGVRAVKRQRPEPVVPASSTAGPSTPTNGVHVNGVASGSVSAPVPVPAASQSQAPAASQSRSHPQSPDTKPMQKVVSALQDYLNQFMKTIEAHAEQLPEDVVLAADGVTGCAMRLARDLADSGSGVDRDVVDAGLRTLQTFSDTVFRACGGIEDKTLAERVRMGIAPLDGAAAKIRRAM